jgi:hypothetical protein
MRKLAIALALGSALLAGPALQAREKLTGEQQLAKLLDGRVAGEPVSCIPLHRASSSRIIDGTAIVYDAGRTIYVNRPTNPDSLDDDDIMVTRLHTSQLCRLDTVRLHDRTGHWFSGFVGLQDFVPYTRAVRTN